MFEQATNAVPQIEGGKVRAFEMTSGERVKLLSVDRRTPT